MRREIALLLFSLAGACVPSRQAVFDAARTEVHQRTGQRISWTEEDEGAASADEVVDALLAQELTPDAAAQIALLNNPRLQARFEELGVARANLVQATLIANPTLSAEYLAPVTADGPQVAVGLEFDVLSAVFQPARRRVALSEFEGTQLEVAGDAIDLGFEARAALLTYVAERERLNVLERYTEAAALTYEVAQRLHAAGNMADLSLLRERAVYENARLQLAAREAGLVHAREKLNSLLGLYGQQTVWRAPRTLPALAEDGAVPAGFESRVIARSIDLEATRRRIDATGRALGLANVQRFIPDLSVGAAAEREDEGWRAGPAAALSVPLFDQGQGRLDRQQAQLRALLDRYTASAIELRAEARRVRDALELARQRVVFFRDVLLPLRAQALEEAVLQHNAMTLGIFDLLETKRVQLQAELERIDALGEYWMLKLASDQLVAGRRPSVEAQGPEPTRLQPRVRGAETLGLGGSH